MVPEQLKVLLLITVATLVGQLASVAFWLADADMHMIWVPGAILLSAFSFYRQALWPLCLLGAMAGSSLALAWLGLPLPKLLLMVTGTYILVALIAYLLRREGQPRLRLDGFAEMAGFVLLAGVVLPALSAWLVVGLFGPQAPHGVIGSWLNVALAHSLGYLLVVPSVTNILWAIHEPQRRRHYRLPEGAVTAVLVLATWYMWHTNWNNAIASHLLVLVPIPLLIWSLVAFGMAGVCSALLLVALMCMWMSLRGNGPFSLMAPTDMVLCVQLWALGLAVPLLFMGVFAEQKFSAGVKLACAYRNLTEMTGKMLAVQEAERTRIARDLHDGINQSLAAISIELSALKRTSAPAHASAIGSVQAHILAVSNDIRDISHELHPSVLRFTGLADALHSFCEKHNSKGAFQICCTIDDTSFLSDQQELGIFRIVQEAVSNIERHAHATQAHLVLQVCAETMRLAIDDNGVGLQAGLATPHEGLGMISMEERARLLGGNFSIRALPAGGLRVEVLFPRHFPTPA